MGLGLDGLFGLVAGLFISGFAFAFDCGLCDLTLFDSGAFAFEGELCAFCCCDLDLLSIF